MVISSTYRSPPPHFTTPFPSLCLLSTHLLQAVDIVFALVICSLLLNCVWRGACCCCPRRSAVEMQTVAVNNAVYVVKA